MLPSALACSLQSLSPFSSGRTKRNYSVWVATPEDLELTVKGMGARRSNKAVFSWLICKQVLIKIGRCTATKLPQKKQRVLWAPRSAVRTHHDNLDQTPWQSDVPPRVAPHSCGGWTPNTLGSSAGNFIDVEGLHIYCNTFLAGSSKVSWWRAALW